MRTTIELRDDQRAALLSLAAKRGQKGFSSLVEEALDDWLRRQAEPNDAVARALTARGALPGSDGDDLAAACAEARSSLRVRDVAP